MLLEPFYGGGGGTRGRGLWCTASNQQEENDSGSAGGAAGRTAIPEQRPPKDPAMMRLTRPSATVIEGYLQLRDSELSYLDVGATRDPRALVSLASLYTIDQRRFSLGAGRALFEQARTALLAWRHFEIPWLELHGCAEPVHPGQLVATLTPVFGVWFLNPCRVVYREDENAKSDETAFAYGTLPGHVEAGEERFSVQYDRTTDAVRFEILAFSRPAVLLARLGYPWARRIQKRFALSSAEALARACGRGTRAVELRKGP